MTVSKLRRRRSCETVEQTADRSRSNRRRSVETPQQASVRPDTDHIRSQRRRQVQNSAVSLRNSCEAAIIMSSHNALVARILYPSPPPQRLSSMESIPWQDSYRTYITSRGGKIGIQLRWSTRT